MEYSQIMNVDKPCRHEYVKIFQRRLKGLERRLMLTRGFLPTGFKAVDFGHLGDGSFCFCSHCRLRLYPRRTQAEKDAARTASAQKILEEQPILADLEDSFGMISAIGELEDDTASGAETSQPVNIEELEFVATDMEDIAVDGVRKEDASLEANEEET